MAGPSKANGAAAESSTPSWRSFNFFDDITITPSSSSSSSSSSIAHEPSSTIHSIRPLAHLPKGVQIDHEAEEDASRHKTTEVSQDSNPFLAVHKPGALQLLNPATLVPITEEFRCLPGVSGGLITHVEYDQTSSRLVVLSEDGGAGSTFPLLRIWQLNVNVAHLAKDSRASWQPRLLTEGRIQHGRKPFPISQSAITDKLSYLACSLANGAVLLLRNLSTTLDAAPIPSVSNIAQPAVTLPKFKVAFQPSDGSAQQEPVTALGFSHSASSTSLFVATLSRVMKYVVVGKGAGSPPVTLDDIGCSLGCSVLLPPSNTASEGSLTESESKLLIARDEALYVIGSHGREDCLAYEGSKANLTHLAASNQVVITSPTEQNSTRISIFDLRGKFLSHTGTLPGDVISVFTDSVATSGGREDILILTTSALHCLREKPLRSKLDLLFRKGLFILASQVTKSHFDSSHADSSERMYTLLTEIWIKYGDYLYDKGDYEGSMKMGYIKSVVAAADVRRGASVKRSAGQARAGGMMGESYIIRKFLDAQRIPLLTLYLQELHKRGLANSDHTTLLLNCYTKMKNTEALDRFIRRSHITRKHRSLTSDSGESDSASSSSEEGTEHLPFDLPTAIKVCRSANYFAQAAYLARKFNMGDDYLRIKIEDTQSPLEALEWLRSREAIEVIHYMRIYTGALISGGDEAERETTDLLIELCSGAHRPRIVNSTRALEQAARAAAVKERKGYLDYLPGGGSKADPPAYKVDDGLEQINGEQKEEVGEEDGAPAYYIPSARQFFPHFMKFPASFKRFLETVALARWGQAIDESGDADNESPDAASPVTVDGDAEQKAIWDTILEILLREGTPSSRTQALHLLKQYQALPYDIHHALILCDRASLTEGVVYLYERLRMYEDVLRLWMDEARETLDGDEERSTTASTKVIDSLSRYASEDPSLYSLTLTFLTSHPILLHRHRHSIASILSSISELRLLSTLEIIQLLSRTPNVNVGLIKAFLDSTVREERSEMEADTRLIESYRAESVRKEKEIEELQRVQDVSDTRVFQSNTCEACGGQLDLPAIHFMCKHSYHARCLGEEADDNSAAQAPNECPTCLRAYGVVSEIRRNNQAMATRHDLFLQELTDAEDPFQAVASMFGKGVFSRAALE